MVLLSSILTAAWHFTAVHAANITSFNLTAISAHNGISTLECWQLLEPFAVSTTSGIQGAVVQQLGNLANASWGTLPARYEGSAHPAPVVQYTAFLSGVTRITIPQSEQQVYMAGGKYGLLLGADTADVTKTGHVSSTLETEITALQIPTQGGRIPLHKVLYQQPCRSSELNF